MDISGKLRQVNGRLRASKVGVTVEQSGDRLRLRATLPPKPNSSIVDSHQQRISLGLLANPAGLKQAEKEARLVGAQLAAREFDWQRWGQLGTNLSCGDALSKFERHYLANGGSRETWEGDYLKALRKLPKDATLTPELLTVLVEGTQANSRSRVRVCMAAGAIAKFAGIDFDAAKLRGSYSPAKVAPRELPSDEAIAQQRHQLTNPAWRWVFGVMACYGLRNHEVFHLDLAAFPVVRVLQGTKTGAREVWPCYPEWADQWQLGTRVLPGVNLERSNSALGHSVTEYLSPLLPFAPYDLRHAWAVRTLLFGWPVELSARQMGHSVEIHTRTYQRWITGQQIQSVYELLVNRSDRPRAPNPPP